MKELKVGMYVRTHNGFISKIIEIKREPISGNEIILIKGNYKGNKDEEYGYVRDYYKKGTSFVYRGEIKEVSENIIDLIEEDDLLSIEYYSPRYEERVTRLFEVDYRHNEYLRLKNAYCDFMLVNNEFRETDRSLNPIIKSVVTKEQFNSVKYEVE